jgi:phage terminase large subunit
MMKPARATINALRSSIRYICHEGGARSGKTYGTVQSLIWYANQHDLTKISVVSHSLPHLKRGALRDFIDIMNTWGWFDENEYNRTDNVYTFPNGSYIEFFGLEDHNRAKGPGRDILFCNEANLLSKALFDQLDLRTRLKTITDLNPSDFDVWCYHLADSADAIKIHSTYKDNSTLPAAQVKVIEGYKHADAMMWKVFGMGERGASQEQIYSHWKLGSAPEGGEVFYGLDFGFRNPTALVKVTLHDQQIYAEEICYQSNMTTSDLIEALPSFGVYAYDEIFCDSAEPKTIEELFRYGWNVRPSDKDVYAGIMKVKSMPIFIAPDSLTLIHEGKKYKWKTDRDGKVIDKEPVKQDDHLIDALRYAVYTKLKQPRLTWAVM